MTERTPLVAGNWKMNGLRAEARARADAIRRGLAETPGRCQVLLCPPFTALAVVAEQIAGSELLLGAQDCHAAVSGAHTGDIAAPMLAEQGCTHVILGHSERRAQHGETDDAVRAKVEAAWAAGLCAVVCVGETEAERDAGATHAVIARQIARAIPDGATAARLVIAYEPVWAIGTGSTPSPTEANAVHAAIREALARGIEGAATRILYGGSVTPDNAAAFFAQPDIDGALVGGASLKPDQFLRIVAAA